MRIGFDAKRAAQNRTGLGNYSRFILDLLRAYTTGNEYILFTPSQIKNTLLHNLSDKERVEYPTSYWTKLRSLWRIWGVTNDIINDDIQLFHGLSNELPINIRKAKKTKSIVTIHDLIFFRYPEYYSFIDRHIYAYKFKKACINADHIIAVSECTKREIIHYFDIPKDKISVVYQGCDEQFKQTASEVQKETIRQKYQLPPHYLLYLGSIESRKNLLLIAKALRHLDEDIQVIAVGKRTSYASAVESYLKENQLEQRMHILSNVPFTELPSLYQMADTFVYPSFFEGFGIPLLEALNSGIPAIGATGSCLEEAGGPHSLYVHPEDEVALAEAIRQTLHDTSLREKMIREGRIYAQQFNEQKIAEELLKVYQQVMNQ